MKGTSDEAACDLRPVSIGVDVAAGVEHSASAAFDIETLRFDRDMLAVVPPMTCVSPMTEALMALIVICAACIAACC